VEWKIDRGTIKRELKQHLEVAWDFIRYPGEEKHVYIK
jgi:hypothetical protein